MSSIIWEVHTFGFSFKPWKQESSIAQKDTIIEYLKETVDEYGIAEHIQYNTHIKQADWSSEKAQWQVSSTHSKTDISAVYNCKYIFLCVGYYNYDQAYMPDFKGIEKYQGQVIHPQYWPENTDYKDKKILVIGSGATAVTLIPSLAKEAAHVTMLQRSPTYIAAKPQINAAANRVAKWFGHRMARWWFILANMLTYTYCQMFPQSAKKSDSQRNSRITWR